MGLLSLVSMSHSEMLLYRGKCESDYDDKAKYEKIEDNVNRINDLARLKTTFIYLFL